MPPVQSPPPPGEHTPPSLASTIFFSAVSKLPFGGSSSWSPRRHRRSSSSDDSVIARSMRGFRFPSAFANDKTKPHHRFGQAHAALEEVAPVFIPNGDGLTAGFTFYSDPRSSVAKARSRKWAEWRCKVKRMPGRVRRKLKSVGRKVRRGIKSGFRP